MDLKTIVNSNLSNEDKLEALARWLTPVIEGLEELKTPSGAYSRDPLTHANNTIDNCSKNRQCIGRLFEARGRCRNGCKGSTATVVEGGEVAAKAKDGSLEIIGVRRGEKEFSVLPQASNHIKIEFK